MTVAITRQDDTSSELRYYSRWWIGIITIIDRTKHWMD